MMDCDHYMMDWWDIPHMGFWWIEIWVIQFVIAFLIYKDAEKREKNGLLWFILVILPWIGVLFLIGYLVIEGEKTITKKLSVMQIKLLMSVMRKVKSHLKNIWKLKMI